MVIYCIVIFCISLFLLICMPSTGKPTTPTWIPPVPAKKLEPTGIVYQPVSPQVVPVYTVPVQRRTIVRPEWVVSAYGAGTTPSPAERLIMDELVRYEVLWEREVSFHGFCNEKGYLHRYDFYLPDYSIVIEYNGKDWHYLPGKIETDKIKANYLQKNQIELIVWAAQDYYHIEDRVQTLMDRLGVFMK